jgi:PAS domain S-box-containing protein
LLPVWAIWWAGDALGVLILAPLLLALLLRPLPPPRQAIEHLGFALGAAALVATALLLLPDWLRVTYLALPVLVWAALRGGSAGATAALAGASVVAAIAAVGGIPYFSASPLGATGELARVQGFLVIAGATCQLLAAAVAERTTALRRAEAAEGRLRVALEGIGMGSFDADTSTGSILWSRSSFELFGLPQPEGCEGGIDRSDWLSRIHPEDVAALRGLIALARESGEAFRSRHRILRADDGRVRWLEMHGRFLDGPAGPHTRHLGLAFDVTEQVEAEAREHLLLREVEHRSKNMLQVIRSLVQTTPFPDREGFVAALDARLGAMARSHALLSGSRWAGAAPREVIAAELSHLAEDGTGRLRLQGPASPRLRPGAAQGLAVILHELATNATKYGALSAPAGRVEVTWHRLPEGGLALRWSERDGPPAGAPPGRLGFGSRLIDATARGSLGGSADFRWRLAGLMVEITVAADRLDEAG